MGRSMISLLGLIKPYRRRLAVAESSARMHLGCSERVRITGESVQG
jgi:hypothetical protein